MTRIIVKFIALAALSSLFVMNMALPAAYGQSKIDGEIPKEGIVSYIFSATTVTILLVLALAAQIVYWYVKRSSKRKPDAAVVVHHSQVTKKHLDRDSMSKLLKASASSKSNPRALEEAIRLSQLTQPAMPEHGEVHSAPAMASVDVDSQEEFQEDYLTSDNFEEVDPSVAASPGANGSNQVMVDASAIDPQSNDENI